MEPVKKLCKINCTYTGDPLRFKQRPTQGSMLLHCRTYAHAVTTQHERERERERGRGRERDVHR